MVQPAGFLLKSLLFTISSSYPHTYGPKYPGKRPQTVWMMMVTMMVVMMMMVMKMLRTMTLRMIMLPKRRWRRMMCGR